MISYILECIAIQLLFLLIYEFFLKKETFFQWNRVYLIGTYLLSLFLPWIKIEAITATVPKVFQEYPEFLWNLNDTTLIMTPSTESKFNISWEYLLLFGGMLLASLFFGYKLYRIYLLKQRGQIRCFEDFTQIIIENSSMAFSFFKSIFLGDKILGKEHKNIVQHELVHIKQKHSYDLIFFELMRIVGWFNPLVYLYQSRVSELHEFIADAHVAKNNKIEQYELLLSEVFQTQNISFINQFFKTSLIKKRIVMLQKAKSKKVWQLKYLLLIPLIMGMLAYTSVEQEPSAFKNAQEIQPVIENETTTENKVEKKQKEKVVDVIISSEKDGVLITPDDNISSVITSKPPKSAPTASAEITVNDVPFATVDQVPVFPGCENDDDQRGCFHENMRKHIRKNFKYPIEAQKKGIQGRVSVLLVIDREGEITNIKMRGPDPLLEEEAKRIMLRLPQMKAGIHKGEKVNVVFSIPITFKVHSNNSKFEIIPENQIANATIQSYNRLVLERQRLLKSTNEKNPVIVNLDQKLNTLKSEIIQKLEKEYIETLEEKEQQEINESQHELEDIPFAVVDQVPIFPGCEGALDKTACFNEKMQTHIVKNFSYPAVAKKDGIQGRVTLVFTISKTGEIEKIRKRGPHKLLEAEAERIIKRLPKMKPGIHEGEKVNVPYSIPITFKVH